MEKQKQFLTSLWAVCFCACLSLLAGCNTYARSSPVIPSSIALTQTSISESQVTPDVIFNLVGTYTGIYQLHGSGSSTRMRLEITKQDVFALSGRCILGNQDLPLLKAYVDTAFGGEKGGIMFTVDTPGQTQQIISLNFNGTVTKQGVMTGDVSASDGRAGTWSAMRV